MHRLKCKKSDRAVEVHKYFPKNRYLIMLGHVDAAGAFIFGGKKCETDNADGMTAISQSIVELIDMGLEPDLSIFEDK